MEPNLFRNLFRVLYLYRYRFLFGFIMVLFSNGLLILNPLIFRIAVSAIGPSQTRKGGVLESFCYWLLGESAASVLAWIPVLLVIVCLSALFKYLMRMAFITVSRDAEMEIRSKIFGRIQRQSMAFFDKYGIGELLSRLTNDISAYRDVLGPGIMYPLFFLTIMIPGLLALFLISKPLAIISLIPLFIIPLVNYLFREKIYKAAMRVQEALGKMSNRVQEHFSSIRIVKSYVMEETASEQFRKVSEDMLKKEFKLSCFQGSLFPFFAFLTKVVTVVLVLSSGWIILGGIQELTPADFVSFMWIQSYIFFPVLMLSWLIPVFGRGRAAYDRLLEIYHEPIEVKDTPFSKLPIPHLADISIKNLSFAYPGSKTAVLKDVRLEIKGGTFIGITGPIGGGKTTLFKLLSREYEIPREMIAIGGKDIHDYSLKAFSAQIVTVEQVPFLFSKTIAENVLFGKSEATLEELENVLNFADLYDTVLEFPEKYETLIGERGIALSGGQKQRLAMARAFLVDRSILLLDDIFSAVDSGTEKRIFHAMRKNFQGKTVLLITHRVSILEKMDKIVYLSDGKITEEGTHGELMQNAGPYAALVDLQQLGERP